MDDGAREAAIHGTIAAMDVRSWQQLMDDVAARQELVDGDSWVALVADPLGAQTIEHLDLLATSAYLEEWQIGREAIRVAVERRDLPDVPYQERLLPVHITVRRGPNVFGRHEMAWFYAWRYANLHQVRVCSSVVVTPSGWWAAEADVGAARPAMAG